MKGELAHLSPEHINDLMSRYYDGGEKIADLLSEYKINIHPSGLVSLFPPIIHEDLFCEYCQETKLVSKRQSREARYLSPAFCPKCGHKNDRSCQCSKCREKEKAEQIQVEKRKQAVICSEYKRQIKIPPVEALTLWDALLLMTLLRHRISEDLYFVFPFEDTPPLAPTYDFKNEIIKHLYAKGLITISPDSPLKAFDFDPSYTHTNGYYPTKVLWEFLPSLSVDEKRLYLNELTEWVKEAWPDTWQSERDQIWRRIAKYECIEYFIHMLAQRDFWFDDIGEKTHSVFEALLTDFPVSQIFYLIYIAVRDTTDYIVKNNLHRSHGKNIFIGAVQRKAERAKAEDWALRHSHRDRECPQTVLSSTFFNVFLELGDKSFEMPIPKSDKEVPELSA